MRDFINFLQQYSVGIFVLTVLGLVVMYAAGVTIDFFCRTFCWGKYNKENQSLTESGGSNMNPGGDGVSKGIGQVIVDFFIKVIDDFRNLLALIIIAIFFIALFYVMVYSTPNFKEKMEAIQAVVASLGGLVGSIIGYYFGESATLKKNQKEQNPSTVVPPPSKQEEPIIAGEPPQG